MLDTLDSNIPPTEPSSELDVGGCFAPFIPRVSPPPAPKPAPKPKPSAISRVFEEFSRTQGWGVPPSPVNTPETGISTPEAPGCTGDDDTLVTEPNEIPAASVVVPLPIPRKATALEIFAWIKRGLLAQTHLHEAVAELVAFWVVSTWFQDVLTILPCLVITGPAHHAGIVLHVLDDLCREAKLLAGFRRSHLTVLHCGCKTNLIWEPHLDKRTADLLGILTDRHFSVVQGSSLARCSKATAIYAGENPGTHKIQNSIQIHLSPTNAALPARPEGLQEIIEHLPVHLDQYRRSKLDYVQHWTWVPSDLPSETGALATALGRSIVDTPYLRQKLVALLKAQNRQQFSQRSGATEALIVEAVLALSRQEREHAFTSEIANEANRLLELRGERRKLSPETVGRQLRKLGLRTRRLNLAGNGLAFDKASLAMIQQLGAVYVEEDLLPESENLHSSQATENKLLVGAMEVV